MNSAFKRKFDNSQKELEKSTKKLPLIQKNEFKAKTKSKKARKFKDVEARPAIDKIQIDKINNSSIISDINKFSVKIENTISEKPSITNTMKIKKGKAKYKKKKNSLNYSNYISKTVDTNESVVEVELVEISSPNIITYSKIPNFLIVFLRENQSIAFSGKGNFKCLLGTVKLLGKIFNQEIHMFTIYAPRCHPKLIISEENTLNQNISLKKNHLNNELENFVENISLLEKENILQMLNDEISSVFLLLKYNNNFTNFLRDLNPFEDLFSRSTTSEFQISDLSDCEIIFTQHTSTIIDNLVMKHLVGNNEKILLCGGKGSGKSTFCRYIVNKFLNKCDCVAYLDCDVGQTEFQPPGFVGLTLINKPLIGPGFTHTDKGLNKCFVGHVSPAFDPLYYLKCLQLVFQTYQCSYSHLPLIVNTMGWSRDIGVSLLIHTVHLVQPSSLIQLDSAVRKDNLPIISPSFVRDPPTDYLLIEKLDSGKTINFNHFSIPSVAKSFDNNSQVINLTARDFRDLMILAHFFETSQQYLPTSKSNTTHFTQNELAIPITTSTCQSSSSEDVFVSKKESRSCDKKDSLSCVKIMLVPQKFGPKMSIYRINFEDVAIHVVHEKVPPSLILSAANSRICSFSFIEPKLIVDTKSRNFPKLLDANPVCSSFGIGVIRSIDMEAKCMYVSTMIDVDLIQRSNCLLIGAVDLPRQLLLLDKKTIALDVPYVSYTVDGFGVAPLKSKGLILPRKRN